MDSARAPPADRPPFRGLFGFNVLTAVALGVGGFFLGAYIGGQIAVGKDYLIGTDQNDVGVFMGFLFGDDRLARRARLLQLSARARLLGRPAVAAARGDQRHRRATSGSRPITR